LPRASHAPRRRMARPPHAETEHIASLSQETERARDTMESLSGCDENRRAISFAAMVAPVASPVSWGGRPPSWDFPRGRTRVYDAQEMVGEQDDLRGLKGILNIHIAM
jgi:hypothetical protein